MITKGEDINYLTHAIHDIQLNRMNTITENVRTASEWPTDTRVEEQPKHRQLGHD
jgi:hypothetical protein